MSETSTAENAWMSALPEEMRSNPGLASFKGKDATEVLPIIAKSYTELQKLIGKKEADYFPKDDWKPEQFAEFHKRLGVPETPDKYSIDPEIAKKAGVPDDVMKAALAEAHKHGMTPRQVKGFIQDWYLKMAADGAETTVRQQEEASAKATAAVQAKYGDKLAAKKELVKQVLALGGGDLIDRITAAGFGNDPQLFDGLVALGEKFVESSSAGGRSGGGFGASREEAIQRIDAIKAERIANPTIDAKYFDPRSAERQEWNRLHAIAHPNQTP